MVNQNAVNPAHHVAMVAAIAQANQRWAQKENITGGIISPDLQRALKFIDAGVTAHAVALMTEEKSPAFFALVAQSLGNKAIMRCCEFFACLSSKNYKMLDGVTALEALSCAYAGATTRSAISFAATGKGNESTSDEVQGLALVRKLQKVLPTVASSTESTQNSRSFGANGFCRALEIGFMQRDAHKINRLVINKSNPFFRAMVKMIESASGETLKQMRGTVAE